jgi:hypothetical protein
MTPRTPIPDPRTGNIIQATPIVVEIDLANPDRIRTIRHPLPPEMTPSDPVHVPHRRTMYLQTPNRPSAIANRTIRVSLAASLDRHQSR